MLFQTYGEKCKPAVLFFHAMGVTGASSEPVAKHLQSRCFCILPTSTVYCAGQTYRGKADEVRQVEDFLTAQGISELALVVASSIGADLAMAFLKQTKRPRRTRFLRRRAIRADWVRDAAHLDAVPVSRHQEPILVKGRDAEENHVV